MKLQYRRRKRYPEDDLGSEDGGQFEVTFYSCDICKKAFSEKSKFKKHLRVHDKDAPAQAAQPDQAVQAHSNIGPYSACDVPVGFPHPLDQLDYYHNELIGMALRNSPEMKCTAQEVIQFVKNNFPRHRGGESKTRLENSIRTNLSIMPHFVSAGLEYKFGENCVNRQHYYTFRPVNDIIHEYEENCSIFI